MNQLGHIIRAFNRFELKYMVTLKQAELLKSTLQRYMLPDEHGHNGGHYSLSNLYYDSPGFHCYHEKMDGVRVRRKLRIRTYETNGVITEDSLVFLEIKQRIDRITQKRRAVLSYAEAIRLCNDRQMPQYSPADEKVIEEIYAFVWQYNLRPASIVRYNRQAFIGTEYDLGLRVTFDTSLSFQSHQLHLHEEHSCLPMLPENFVVMEIKLNERMPTWLTEMIAAHNLKLTPISKYCRSIEAARCITSIHWAAPMAESSQDVLASSYSLFNAVEKVVELKK